MDKGKSKGDLRAAGKKRLEEFRQKRQQKGSSTKASPTTTALKALSESEQSSGDQVVDATLTKDLPNEDSQGFLSEKTDETENVSTVEPVNDKVLEEGLNGNNVSLNPSPASSVASPIQRVRLGGQLALESSEQSDSPCDQGSSNGNSEEQTAREAVYTILWENHGTDHPQRNEEWQENTYVAGESIDERALDQGNYPTFRVDDENYGSETGEVSNTQRKLSGSLENAVESLQVDEDTRAWDEHSPNSVFIQQRPLQGTGGDAGSRDYIPESGIAAETSLKEEGERFAERIPLERGEERENSELVAELAIVQQRLKNALEETAQERESLLNKIGSLKAHIGDCTLERDEAIRTRDLYLKELEGGKLSQEKEYQIMLEKATMEMQQQVAECEEFKAQGRRMAEERDQLLSNINSVEKELETLRAESTRLAHEMKSMEDKNTQLAGDLYVAREQAHGAIEREALIISEFSRLKEERESEISQIGKLQVQLQDLAKGNSELEDRCNEFVEELNDLRVVNQKLGISLAESEQERQSLGVNLTMEHDRVKCMEDEQLKFHELVENLTHRLHRHEEEHTSVEAADVRAKLFEQETIHLESSVKNLSGSLEAVREEKEDLASKLSVLQIDNVGLVTEIAEAKHNIKVMADEISNLNVNICTLQEQNNISVEDLNLQIENLEMEKVELLSQVSTTSQLQEELQREILRLINEAGNVKIESDLRLEEFTQKLESSSLQIRSLEHSLDANKEQLHTLGAENTQLSKRVADLEVKRNDLFQRMEMVDLQDGRLHREKSTLASELVILKEQLHQLEEEKEKVESSHKVSISLIQEILGVSLQSEALCSTEGEGNLHSTLELLQQHVRYTHEEKEHLVLRLDTERECVKELETEKEQLGLKVAEFEEVLRNVREHGSEVAMQLDNWKQVAARVGEEKGELERQLMAVEIQLEVGIEDQSHTVTELKRLQVLLTRLETENIDMTSKMEESGEELELSNEQVNRLELEKVEMEKTFGLKLEVLEQKVRVLDGQKAELEHQLSETGEELVQFHEQVKRLDAGKSDMEASFGVEVEMLRHSVRDLEDEKLQLQEQVKEMVDEKVQLTSIVERSEEFLKKMTEEKLQVESDLQLLQESLERLSKERNQALSENQSLSQSLKKLADEKDFVVSQLKVAEETLRTLTEEKFNVESELHASLQKLKDLKKSESDIAAEVENLQSKLVSSADENGRLEAELKDMEQQVAEQQVQKNYQHLDEALSPTLAQGGADMVPMDSEEVSTTSHAANVRLVKKLVKVFEGRASEDVPDRHLRGVASPVTELFNQARAMKKTADILQQERDAAIHAELATRSDLESSSKKLKETSELSAILQASVKELEQNLADVKADRDYLQTKVKSVEEERVKLVASLNDNVCALQAENCESIKNLVTAAEGNLVLESDVKQSQKQCEELELLIHAEKDASEKLMSRLGMLATLMEESLSLNFIEILHLRESASDVLSQVEYGLGLVIEKLLPELNAKAKALEEECHLARTATHESTELNSTLQQEKDSLLLEKEALKAEMERKVTLEVEARANFERHDEIFTVKLQEVQNELDILKADQKSLQSKLEMLVSKEFPHFVVKPLRDVESSFENCWTLVCLMFEGSSKKLQDVQMQLAHAHTEFDEVMREERAQHQTSIGSLEADREALSLEVVELCTKVKGLEEERGSLQQEQEHLALEIQALQDEKQMAGKLTVDYQGRIQILDSKLHDMQREVDLRKVLEVEAKAEYDREIKSWNLKLQEIENELDNLRDARAVFENKIENAVCQNLPEVVIKRPDVKNSGYDFCWMMVSLVFEYSSKKQHSLQLQLAEMQSKMDMTQKEEEMQVLQDQVQRMTEELAKAIEAKNVVQSEFAQSEKRLLNTKERLTLAINKGKAVVQQRDAVKIALAEKTAELERVVCMHTEMLKSKDFSLQEAEAKISGLNSVAERASGLEADLAVALAIIRRLESSLSEIRSSLDDFEVAVDRITTPPEEKSMIGVAKVDWVTRKLADSEMRAKYYESKAEDLILELTSLSSERENLMQKLRDVTADYDQLQRTSAEDVLEKSALESDIVRLQEAILEMKADASEHTKLRQEVSSAMKLLVFPKEEQKDTSITNSFSNLGLEAAIAFVIERYTSAVHEVEDLRQEATLLIEAAANSEREKTSLAHEKVHIQEVLDSQTMELREVHGKWEESYLKISQQSSEFQALVQETQVLRDELLNSNEQLHTLRLDLSRTEKKATALMEHLKGVIDSNAVERDKNVQVGVSSQSLYEQVMELENLAVMIIEQTARREIELQDVHKNCRDIKETTTALSTELDIAKKLHTDLEQEIIELKKVVNSVSWLERPSSSLSPSECVTWLIDALQTEKQKVEGANQEVDLLRRSMETILLQMEEIQGKHQSLSIELANQLKENEANSRELERRNIELQAAEERLLAMADNTSALQLELNSVRNLGTDLEKSLLDCRAVVEDVSLLEGPPPTSSPAEWIFWLLQALQQEQSKASQTAQELELLKRATDTVSLEARIVQGEYETLRKEILNYKAEKGDLLNRLKELSEEFESLTELAAQDSAVREQALYKELNSRNAEYSEVCKELKNLQKTLVLQGEELNKVRQEMQDAVLGSSQRDMGFQTLMEDKQRLHDKLVEVEGQRDSYHIEATEAVKLKSTAQREASLIEQKLAIMREKLSMAVKKGKGLEKQRDTLKQSLAEQTEKMESMIMLHMQALSSKDSELQGARVQMEAAADRLHKLEVETTSVGEKAIAFEILLEQELSSIEFLDLMVSEGPIERIRRLGLLLRESQNTVLLLEQEVENSRDAVEVLKSKLRDSEETVQSLLTKDSESQEVISVWVQKVEEAESRAVSDRTQYENEIDNHVQSLKEAEVRLHTLSSQMKEMELLLEKTHSTLNASEVARSKAVSKLAYSRTKLNELVRQSQELVGECEALHKSIQDRNAEIVELKNVIASLNTEPHREKNQVLNGDVEDAQTVRLNEEVVRMRENADAEVQELQEQHGALQRALARKTSELEQIQNLLEGLLAKGDNTAWMEHNISNSSQVDDNSEESDLCNGGGNWVITISALQQRLNKLTGEGQAWRLNAEKKESQLQNLRKELHELSVENASLQAGLQAKDSQVEKLQTELTAAIVPVGDNIAMQSEIEEVGPRSKWVVPGSAATHVRGPRRPAQSEIAIDMNEETNELLTDLDDKGHGFSSLTNSRVVPKGTRALADRLDGLCVAGGRILMRQPSARLGLAMYWILIHVYIAMVASRVLIL